MIPILHNIVLNEGELLGKVEFYIFECVPYETFRVLSDAFNKVNLSGDNILLTIIKRNIQGVLLTQSELFFIYINI